MYLLFKMVIFQCHVSELRGVDLQFFPCFSKTIPGAGFCPNHAKGGVFLAGL